MEQTHKRDISH